MCYIVDTTACTWSSAICQFVAFQQSVCQEGHTNQPACTSAADTPLYCGSWAGNKQHCFASVHLHTWRHATNRICRAGLVSCIFIHGIGMMRNTTSAACLSKLAFLCCSDIPAWHLVGSCPLSSTKSFSLLWVVLELIQLMDQKV